MSNTEAPIRPQDVDLHHILAKSADKSFSRGEPESLVMHTWQVLSRLADQRRMRPTLAADVAAPRLWHWLYWGTFLHDFGKAAEGFQAMLRGGQRWGYRHEVLSLAFVEWLFPPDHPDYPYVVAVIACHHRDAAKIVHDYPTRFDYPEDDLCGQLLRQISDKDKRRLHQWLTGYGWAWAEQLGFAPHIEAIAYPTRDEALARLQPTALHRAIRTLKSFTDPLYFCDGEHNALIGTLLRGMILTADHAGSAHSAPFLPAALAAETVKARVKGELFPHQQQAGAAPSGSALLISPTSSGKTEAALLWLARQQVHDGRPSSRVFYLLPYQASMNAAHLRLQGVFPGKDEVGLQHGRMMQVLYARAFSDDGDAKSAAAYARQQSEIASLLRFPVTVMSPYQLLKVPYQLKGFEALLTNFYGGCFILDEIHAYDAKRLALIIATVQFLQRVCRARFFIMTATLPPPVQKALHAALPDLHRIEAEPETFRRFQRHRAHLLDGGLLDEPTLANIVRDAADNSVLICCNTVKRAFEVHAALTEALNARYPDADFEVILIHSRFNGFDRNAKEAAILSQTGVGSQKRGKTVVIATQVVEVSLNIDLDVLYTEAAPLEALLQRFGRVNRGRPAGSPAADVYVVREQPKGGYRIYERDLIDAALACLAESTGEPIDESLVGKWLARIYTGDTLARWQAEYDESLQAFHRDVIHSLRPFNNSALDDLFFQMFDGIDVLPHEHLSSYEQTIRNQGYLAASGMLVPMAWRDFSRLMRMKKAWHETQQGRDVYIVDAPYSSASGLDLQSAYQALQPHNLVPTTDIDTYTVPEEAD